jgi:hypothetical protein
VTVLLDAGIKPDPWQVRALRSWRRYHLLNCCRQSGKSSTAAGLACWLLLHQDDALVLLVSRAERQSGELYRKARLLLERLPYAPKPIGDTALTLELPNRSRLVS